MKSLVKTLKAPQKFVHRQFYSTAGNKKNAKVNPELAEIPTEEEIEYEVRD